MNKDERISMIIAYAKKVLQYPVGSNSYDPVDGMNLTEAIQRYEKEEAERLNPSKEPKIDALAEFGCKDFESFKNLVNGYPLDKKCYLPLTFRFKSFKVEHFNGGYTWSAEHNYNVIGYSGYAHPMKNNSRIQTFKSEKGARESLIRYMKRCFNN